MFKTILGFIIALTSLYADPIQLEMEPVPFGQVTTLLTDIEGTTTSISFVHDVLFPYAKQHVGQYLLDHQNEPTIRQIIQDVNQLAGTPDATVEQTAATLHSWMEQDKKITPLKTLQGFMWEDGYNRGDFQAHLYLDAYQHLNAWKEQGLTLYVYSSGSVLAQKLLFSHTTYGDITPLFSGYFDTKIGGKKEAASYSTIAQKIGVPPQEILFLSDSIDEVNAAQAAGMQTVFICRDGTIPAGCNHLTVTSFDPIHIN